MPPHITQGVLAHSFVAINIIYFNGLCKHNLHFYVFQPKNIMPTAYPSVIFQLHKPSLNMIEDTFRDHHEFEIINISSKFQSSYYSLLILSRQALDRVRVDSAHRSYAIRVLI